MLSLQEISSLAILVPLFLVGAKFKTGDFRLRLFFLFLLYGAVVDGVGMLTYRMQGDWTFHRQLFLGYFAFEMLFFLWISTYFLKEELRRNFRIYLGVLYLLILIARVYMFFNGVGYLLISLFAVSYLIITSALSGFSLLKMSEQGKDLTQLPWFWILSGIFFYSFGSFFVDSLLYSNLIQKAWGVRNVVNIIQYGFFSMGLYLLLTEQKSGK